jgi:uncharacterized membrane protein
MAIHVEREIEIERPPERVFDYLAHGENLPRWMDEFTSVEQVSEGPPTLGTTYRYKMKRGAESTFEWEQFETGRRLAWHGPPAGGALGKLEPKGTWELEGAGPTTRVRMTMDPEPSGLLKLMAPLMARAIRKGSVKDFERLKGILEGRL